MNQRQTAAVTLGVLGVICVFMAVFGLTQLTRGFPKASFGEETSACVSKTITKGSKVRAGDVTVSVFNASKQNGLASKTMEQLLLLGFGAGDSGNVDDKGVSRVEVRANDRKDPAARLVALQFGRSTKIVTDKKVLGVGIVVVVGNEYTGLAKKKPRGIKAKADSSVCSPPLD